MGTRLCAGCGHRGTARARFCERCGASLTATARPLRSPGALEARILQERTAIRGERKQVTVMYADVVGSMDLTSALGAERWGFVLDRFLAMSAGAVHAYEGTVNQFTGDGLLAVFGAPLSHEDHARRACLAVLELQREVAGLTAELERTDGATFAVRCGLHSGEVVIGDIGDDVHMDFVPVGNTTALGRRIEALAPPGSAAMSAATAALVEGEFELRDLGEFDVKGADLPQRVLELVGPGEATTRLDALAATRGLSPFVGRDGELSGLEAALERALEGDGSAVAVVGEAGVGKSRLVHEFVAGCVARGVAVDASACLAHGRVVPLLPVLTLLRGWLGVAEHDVPAAARARVEAVVRELDPALGDELPVLFDLLGVPDPDRPLARATPADARRRILDVLARLVAARGRHPTVLVVEDVHWIDDASAAFLDEIITALHGTRTVVVVTARPERAVPWSADEPHRRIDLGPLGPQEAGDMLSQLLGRDQSVEDLGRLIGDRTRGNPFFIEEVVRALAEDGQLEGLRGAYQLASGLDGVVLPVTVQAGLAARLDRLPAREKALVQTMAVIGGEVPEALVREVAGLDGDHLQDAVAHLERAQWIVPRDTEGGREHQFKHPLAQEVAYASQLAGHRTRAHRAVAAAIERLHPDGLDERASLLAHHCDAAADAAGAARWHARAAVWTESRSPADSLRHWRRVRELAPEVESADERQALSTKAGIGVLGLVWRLGMSEQEATAIYAEGAGSAERSRLDLRYGGILMHSHREREALGLFHDLWRQALAARDRGLALTVAMALTFAEWLAGSMDQAATVMDRALVLAEDDPALGSGIVFVCPLAHAHGHRALARAYRGDHEGARTDFELQLALGRRHGDAEAVAHGLANRGLTEAEAGRFDTALEHAAEGLELAERSGNTIGIVVASAALALAEAGAGRAPNALIRAEQSLTTVREQDVGHVYQPLLLTAMAQSLLELGEAQGALAAAEEAVAIAGERGLTTCALSASIVLAQVLMAAQGPGGADRVDQVLTRATGVVQAAGAALFAPRLERERLALARMREGAPA